MKKILLIEDEYFISDLYKKILQDAGFEVITAMDGEQGLQKAKLGPDLILLDIMLPGLNGLQLLQKLKAENSVKNIPVVLITNLAQANIIKEAFNLGACGYFLKVRLKPEDLIEQVNIFLTNPNFKMDYEKLVFD
ncbi:hypothetical protein A3C26_04390 [Candidatus Daviesbacteria bacterium RIFCSPHIGHO2_02_FULL_39_12]|uniref:Response regulatory domain-containing protein n=2 Tax=Candidatus Daviesiibacteriota TaxID=1752718 RepID=A0A1F5J8T6_9BACT|nr:MAG: hypothetical protein A3C26_04390 [Candidatus Daviesbacteria bacterium RIFCSPHIGHO2_02_FULL_39_12]OGE71619.1 MAG: hypothetical protein A3H40_01260 [Candidatus Daviesbacteria bacterium RIFCSPLOWO2_02_FULL_38_15]